MEGIREIALTFCVTAVLAAAVGLIRGRVMEKSGRYIISLIILCSVLSAILSADISFDDLYTGTENGISEETAMNMSLAGAEYLISSALREEGIAFENVCCIANNPEADSIIINEVVITGAEKGAADALLAGLGIDCKVTYK